MNKKILVLFILSWFPLILNGHKINIFATVEGNRIYTRSYASDGSKIKGGVIEVYDSQGNKLVSGKTDSLGEFSFVIPKKDDLKIVVTGSMGHRAETIMDRNDLSETEIVIAEKVQPKEKSEITKTEPVQLDTLFLKKTIEEALDARLHPIIKMLAEQREKKISLTEVIGGIGYIIGITGLAFFFLGRKKNV